MNKYIKAMGEVYAEDAPGWMQIIMVIMGWIFLGLFAYFLYVAVMPYVN